MPKDVYCISGELSVRVYDALLANEGSSHDQAIVINQRFDAITETDVYQEGPESKMVTWHGTTDEYCLSESEIIRTVVADGIAALLFHSNYGEEYDEYKEAANF